MTQAEWFDRLKSWVPDWMFSQSSQVEPIFQACAAMMAKFELERDALLDETFIDTADSSWLDTHGHERSVTRATGELDPNYQVRVRTQNLISKCDIPDLKAIIDQLLIAGTCAIREDADGGLFFGRGTFCNRGAVVFPIIKDAFTIVVDRQVHKPYAFVNRSTYANRRDFDGQATSNTKVFELIIKAVNDNRAFGAPFRVVERLN